MFDDVPPTLKEAAAYFEAHFEDGSMRSWITEYYDRKKGKKAVRAVGDSIHADDRRYIDIDLWKNHFKAKTRDLYKPQGVRHSAKCPHTRWVAIEVNNHANEPTVSQDEWLARYAALRRFPTWQCRCEVHPTESPPACRPSPRSRHRRRG